MEGFQCLQYLLEVQNVPSSANNAEFTEAFQNGNYFVMQFLIDLGGFYCNTCVLKETDLYDVMIVVCFLEQN